MLPTSTKESPNTYMAGANFCASEKVTSESWMMKMIKKKKPIREKNLQLAIDMCKSFNFIVFGVVGKEWKGFALYTIRGNKLIDYYSIIKCVKRIWYFTRRVGSTKCLKTLKYMHPTINWLRDFLMMCLFLYICMHWFCIQSAACWMQISSIWLDIYFVIR